MKKEKRKGKRKNEKKKTTRTYYWAVPETIKPNSQGAPQIITDALSVK
jgi:hypothetical protein